MKYKYKLLKFYQFNICLSLCGQLSSPPTTWTVVRGLYFGLMWLVVGSTNNGLSPLYKEKRERDYYTCTACINMSYCVVGNSCT